MESSDYYTLLLCMVGNSHNKSYKKEKCNKNVTCHSGLVFFNEYQLMFICPFYLDISRFSVFH